MAKAKSDEQKKIEELEAKLAKAEEAIEEAKKAEPGVKFNKPVITATAGTRKLIVK